MPNLVIKILNFVEIIPENSGNNPFFIMISLSLGTVIFFYVIFFWSSFGILRNKNWRIQKYLELISNILFLILDKVLSGPLISLIVLTFSCNDSSPYHQGITCYNFQYLVFCGFSGLLGLLVLFSIIISSQLYFDPNPFKAHFLGYSNKNFALSKGLLKIIFPACLVTLSISFQIEFLYVVGAPLFWGIYLYFHLCKFIAG